MTETARVPFCGTLGWYCKRGFYYSGDRCAEATVVRLGNRARGKSGSARKEPSAIIEQKSASA